MKSVVIIFVLIVNMVLYVQGRSCNISKPTIRYVTSCPKDELSWKEAAKRKNCNTLANVAVNMGCVKNSSDFVYHCVINHWLNATLEVCAATRYIQAYCVDYNTVSERITENYDASCASFTPPCPSRYISTDAYKYQGCYNIATRTTVLDTTKSDIPFSITQITPTTEDDSLPIQSVIPIVVLIIFAVVFCATTLLLVRWIKRLHQQKDSSKERSQTQSELDIEMQNLIGDDADPTHSDYPDKSKEGYKERPQHNGIEILELRDDERLKEIKGQAERHIKSHQEFDHFYFETSIYKKIQNCFRDHGVVIIEGQTGCGKTAAATHLLLNCDDSKETVILMATQYSDLYQHSGDNDSRVIYLVDDMDIDTSDTQNWLAAFEMLHKKINDSETIHHFKRKHHKIRLVVTTFHVPSKFLGNPLFSEEVVINVPELSKREKIKILQKQMKYAEKCLEVKSEDLDKDFQEEIDKARTSIGFPLAAQLYAREEKYRKSGINFFKNPKILFQKSLKDFIDNDKTNNLLAALIIVYLRELYEGEDIPGDIASAKLREPNTCENAINPQVVKTLDLRFNDLSDSAKKLQGIFFLKTEEDTFRFCHNLVRDSVGAFLFEKYFETVVVHFPVSAIAYETHEFSDFSDKEFTSIAARFILEMKKENMEELCKCSVLKNVNFLNIMGSKLEENKSTLKEILNTFDKKYHHLPLTYWCGRFGLLKFSEMLKTFVDELIPGRRFIHRYFVLLGEFSTTTPKDLDNKLQHIQNSSEIRKVLFSDRPSCIHEIISSNMQDEDVKAILEDLVKDGRSVDVYDKNEKTPLMIAVLCDKKRKSTIDLLLEHSDLTKVDKNNYSLFHHCVAAEKDDMSCSQILMNLLKALGKMQNDSKEKDVLRIKSYSGLTVLHRAAIVTKYSRIQCMQILLGFDEDLCKEERTDDEAGKSPIYNLMKYLRGNDVLVELERLLRVCMLQLYGCSPYHKKKDDKSAWEKMTEDKSSSHKKLIQIVRANPDQEEMIEIIESVLDDVPENVERCDIKFYSLLEPPEKMSSSLSMLYKKATQCLGNKKIS
ncbi:uncharacterized protein LOC125645962 isoform X2 [Ostrea edulis]|nr:uncharacterized protein LOC125645962 isoform X2 [Ostrea edulis]XP_056013987.1 uncharacterized protein LOC125645962 isoform X2 [Ostrea edulis]XP_056013998.1 uncharacterized protein LOC125645962 isoform X2 [Ostrea edulis]